MQTNAFTNQPPAPELLAEALSAWKDGEALPQGVSSAQVADWLLRDAHAQALWQGWHQAADCLRDAGIPAVDARQVAGVGSPAWLDALHGRMAEAAPAAANPESAHQAVPATLPVTAKAANDASFRWKMAAGFASLAAVGLFSWNLLGGQVRPSSVGATGQVAVQTVADPHLLAQKAPVAADTLAVDANTRMLLTAHAQLGDSALMQETAQPDDADLF